MNLYPSHLLPSGFKYPVELSELGAAEEGRGWWLVDADSEAGELFWSVREHDGRDLVPFAKMGDDIACFDGDDTSGNPAVLVLVLDDSGRRYGYPNFSTWLDAARATVG